jgi:pyruvate,orthophosphate dikinase
MIKSKALEVNLASYHVDVEIDERYLPFQHVMSQYFGLMEGVNTFLKELSHPYKNWQFIISEARGYGLDYFHLFQQHEQGVEAAKIIVALFIEAISQKKSEQVAADAMDNLLLYLQKIIKETHTDQMEFLVLASRIFSAINSLDDDTFFLFVKSYYQINRIATLLDEKTVVSTFDLTDVNTILIRYYHHTYEYWLKEKDPLAWFLEEADEKVDSESIFSLFSSISHATILQKKKRLEDISRKGDLQSKTLLKNLLPLPGYNDIVEMYCSIPQRLLETGKTPGQGKKWKIIFLFHIMNISGLSLMHEEALRGINRTVSWLIDHESHTYIRRLIEKTFSILKKRADQYPLTMLNCVLNMGKGVYRTDDIDLINFLIDSIIDLKFQSPMLDGVGNDWQVRVNNAHLQNVRTWLSLIQLSPRFSVRLISNLIIHLAVGGIYIKDTDLFPRDITRFINTDIGPVYNLAKQLTRLFPVYFNDIGAEGKLREVSTRLDELCYRKDILIHFLRKQSHVESSNRILRFMEATLHFWVTRDKSLLQPYVPPSIYCQIETSGPYIDGVHKTLKLLIDKGFMPPEDFLYASNGEIKNALGQLSGSDLVDHERVLLLIRFYKLLNEKYNLNFTEILRHIDSLNTEALPNLDHLRNALAEPRLKNRLNRLLDYLLLLKEVILSPQIYPVKEDIYKKRHFTVDIPSMYGSYHEMKFDALGLTFRIESLVNVLFEQLVEEIDLGLITKATFYEIYDYMLLFNKALSIDGIQSSEMGRLLDLLAHSLEVKGFTFTQYLDIFKGFSKAVKNITNDFFSNIHGGSIYRILRKISPDMILERYNPKVDATEPEKFRHRIMEIFFRDRISMSLGLQQLDLFLSSILNTLFKQSNQLPKDKLLLLLNYDPQRAITSLVSENNRAEGIIHLGNKGLNLMRLRNFGLPVPPGVIITTEVFRYRKIINDFGPAKQNFREQVAHHITALEKITGKSFNNPKNPLLLSVRSGSSISQPGMMDTFLNVGINEEIAAGLAAHTGNAWFAWDSYRRFLQSYGMSFGLNRDDFDLIILEKKQEYSTLLKSEFTGKQMRDIAQTYKTLIQDSGHEIPEDPIEQLHATIKNVLYSWDSPKAMAYRNIMGISEDWGTAVTIQEMVYGNISSNSGSGVIFTHNPHWAGDTINLWGDFSLENQGEDVVSGLVSTLPISLRQQEIEMRNTDITLESHFPEIYKAMKEWAIMLIYKEGWGPQEMEFTFEGPSMDKLYLLQTRDMAIRERSHVLAFDYKDKEEACYLGNGIGVSGGAMSGRAVYSIEEMDHFRSQDPNIPLILFRRDTVPDDIREIHAADGLLTAKGGVTSHAAVVAHRLGKTCVVGCGNLDCDETTRKSYFGKTVIRSGDYISIDGREGSVYQGVLKIKKTKDLNGTQSAGPFTYTV